MYRAFTGKFKLSNINFVFPYNKKKFCIGSDRFRVVRSPCVSVPFPAEDSNLFSSVFQQFPKHSKKIALIDGVTGRECSYAELQESIVNMASGLVRSGLEKGDVLTLVSSNSAEFCITFFATLATGGTVSTCNPLYTAEELAYQFRDSNSKYVATTPALLTTVKEAINKSGCVEKIIVISNEGGIGERNHDLISYQNLVKSNGSQFPCDVALNSRPLDTALISYSSGTTGPPKGVMLTHYNLSLNIMQLTHSKEICGDFYCSGNLLAVMPFFHGFGMQTMLNGLYMGSSKIIMPKFVPKLFLNLVERYKITGVSLVPPIILFLANHQMVDEYDVSSLQHITYGAAPTPNEIAVKLKRRLGLQHLQQCFGMTEACATHVTPVDVFKPASVGIPLSHVSCKIVDVDTGAAMGPNCQGELVVRGPQVCYYHMMQNYKRRGKLINNYLWLATDLSLNVTISYQFISMLLMCMLY